MPGFTAQSLEPLNRECNSSGPTAMAELDRVIYLAGDGKLLIKRSGTALRREGGASDQVKPFGLAALRGKLYGTEPQCGVAASTNPVTGETNCDLVEIVTTNAKVARRMAPCGYGLAADPRTGSLTVALRTGDVVQVDPASGATRETLLTGLGTTPVTIDWSPDGNRLFIVQQQNSAVLVWDRGGGAPRNLGSAKTAVAANAVNLAGSVLVGGGTGTAVRAIAVDKGAQAGDVATAGETPSAVLATGDGVYVAFPSDLWLLRGQYTKPPSVTTPTPPPTTPPPTTPPPRVTPPTIVASVAPPPPQAPPPPPPPAPPAPPLATAAQVVAQPSAVANPAIVPGETEREAALRLAATGRHPPPAPSLIWLALAVLVCMCGLGAGAGVASRRAHRFAWAHND
jgi:hypothetical protein